VDNENYAGLLSFTNNWARAMLLKHIFFAGMVGVSAYITWRITPALRHAALLKARNKDSGEEAHLERQRTNLLRVNLLLGITVLIFTALARIA
jgi:putative copper export protein